MVCLKKEKKITILPDCSFYDQLQTSAVGSTTYESRSEGDDSQLIFLNLEDLRTPLQEGYLLLHLPHIFHCAYQGKSQMHPETLF